MRRMIFLLTVVALMALGFASPALAAPGDLDTSFGNNGTVVTRFVDDTGEGLFSPGDDLAIQPDGKAVVAGGSSLARYNPNGSLDPSFDGDGKVVGSGGGGDLAIQPNGKIVVVGQVSRRNSLGQLDFDFQVLRYNADGSPDATFSDDGKLATSVGPGNAFDSAHGVVVQPDGKIVVAGYSYDYGTQNRDIALVRYNSGGTLDTTFDTDGKLTTDIGSGQDAATDIALQSEDGKLVIAGFSGNTTNENGVTIDDDFVAARYNLDGSLDATFDGDGKLTTSFGSGTDQARTLALQPDGKIVLAGASQHDTESNGNFINDFAVARYNADGSLDTTFDTNGTLTTAIGFHDDVASDLILQNDGKIVAAGRTTVVDADGNPHWKLVLTRYNTDGALDPLFSGDGITSDQEVNQQTVAAGLQANGKILVSSTRNQGQFLARYYGGDDVTPPEVAITAGPSGTISAGTARFEFSSSEAAVDFRCRLDDAPEFTSCSSPKDYAGLSNGGHTFRVRGVDASGNVGSAVIRTWTVAPETTSQTVAAGETVTSDAEGDGATATDPVETSITSPKAGPVSIEESTVITQSSAGYSLLGQQVNIEAPSSTVENPLRFVFTFDSTLIPAGENESTIQVFRNGTPIEPCADQSGTASPDPCVLGRELLADGDVRFTVLTSHASAWNFGVVAPDTKAPRVTGVTPLNLATGVGRAINVTASFSEKMAKASVEKTDPATGKPTTFTLVKKTSTGTSAPIAATVRYVETTTSQKAILNPTNDLQLGATYIATVTTAAKDLAGNRLDQNASKMGNQKKTWRFTVGT